LVYGRSLFIMTILNKVKDTVKRYNLIRRNDKILVGVSGGPDSVALLYLLNILKKELKLKLHIAHLDHMLRKDSVCDKEFVQRLADKVKLPLTVQEVNIRALSKKGSQEEIARNERLSFFIMAAKAVKADKIALGHNFDDQAETVLMRILRGAGLYGLSGILPKRMIEGYWFIRPLIEVKRKEIAAFLNNRKIGFRIDKSNLEDIYLRNKIRNKLLPYLEKEYNPNIKEVLSNMAQISGYDYDYLSRVAVRKMGRPAGRLAIKKLIKMHPAMRRLILRLSVVRLKGDTRKFTFAHIKEIEDLIFNRPFNSIVDLPKAISVIKKKKTLLFYHR